MASTVKNGAQSFYVGIYPPTGDYELLDNQPAIGGVVLTKDTTKADLDLDKVFQYRGQVDTYDDLPTNGLTTGDTYNVADTGENYAWNGAGWDLLTGTEAIYWRQGALESMGSTLTIDSDKNPITNLILEDITDVTSTKNEVNQLHSSGVVKADLVKLHAVTASKDELNILDGATLTTTELNYVDGVTSSIQTQIDNETSARITADNTLQDNIDTVSENLAQEISDRQSADTTLQSNIDTEANTRATSDEILDTKISGKIDKYSELPQASKGYANKIVQYVGETDEDYINGYFYKCVENGDKPDSIEFTPKTGVSTVVTVSPEDFVAFITPWCEGRPFGPSDITHGNIGIYSSTQYAMTIMTDDDNFAHGVFTIAELQEAGFTFTPPFSAQQGATYVCSIGQKDYAWQQTNVQPETDISGKADKEELQAQVAALTKQINDLKLLIPQEVFDASSTRSAMNSSGKVTLCEDINLGVLNIGAGIFASNNTSVNLNGHTLQSGPTGGRPLLLARGSAKYTFNGKGQVIDTSDDSSPIWCASQNASITINDGTFIAQKHTETIYCELGTITINGGVFKTDMEDKRYLLNCKDANYQAGTAKIIVKGGEFWDFDPSNNPEGAGTSYVADGYTVTSREEDGHTIYTVVKA